MNLSQSANVGTKNMRKQFRVRMKNSPKVTIVTITFNLINAEREKTFRQCLESVHNQTYENIEHIIIDGASTDGTLDLIKEYENKGWITSFSEPDNGIYFALNNGLEKANGKYITFLHSDDFYHDNRGVEKSVEKLEKHNAVFSYADCRIFDENDIESGIYKAKFKKLYYQFPFVHQTMFCKTDILKQEGGFDTKYKSGADYNLIIKLALKKYKSVNIPLCFTTFRRGGFSAENLKLSMDECFEVYYDNYSNACGATKEEIRNLFDKKIISNRLMMEFLKKTRPENLLETLSALLILKIKK